MKVFSLQGFVKEVKWDAPVWTETPKLSVSNYNKDFAANSLFSALIPLANSGIPSVKIYCDLNRICEIEDAVVEWYEEAYYQKDDRFDLSFMS